MSNPRGLCAFCFLVFFMFSPALAQVAIRPAEGEPPAGQLTSTSTVTASATAERVRFTAPGSVVQMHLQVYDNGGQLVVDVTSKGNVFDWNLQDGGGARLSAGSYLSVVTIKNLSGKLSQRVGSISVGEERIDWQRADAVQMTAGQQQAVGPVEENSALTILQPGETEAATVVAHDGTNGEITRSSGALSFRLGDFFTGQDSEQMRLTEEGNLGIGTDSPQARLDVAGVIRTSKGIEFSNTTDGNSATKVTKLTTGANGSLQQTMADGTVVINATGSGTQNRIPKWVDDAGTLGDSLLKETATGIEVLPAAAGPGINPTILNNNNVGGFSVFQFYPGAGPNTNMSFAVSPRGAGQPNNHAQFSIFRTDLLADGTNYEFASMRARDTDFVLGTGKSGTGQNRPFMLASGFLSDNVTNNGQLYLATNGNVGVGSTSPGAKLHVVGSQPPAVSTGNGTDTAQVLQVIGGNGGNTAGQGRGGHGADVLIQAGNGGSQSQQNSGGAGLGGSITLVPGVHGVQSGGPTVSSSGDVFLAPSNGGQYGENVLVGPTETDPANSYFKLHVAGNAGGLLRVARSVGGGTVASFGSNGDFKIDAAGIDAGRLVVKENGNVGVGAPLPAAKLDILPTATHILFGDCGLGYSAIGFVDALTGCGNYSLLGEGTNTYLNRPSGGAIGFRENNADQMTISPGGNVGIGTTNPASATGGRVLHIEGPTSGLRLVATSINGRDWEWQSTVINNLGAMNLSNLTNGNNPLTVLAGGNVGVGTTGPVDKLQVAGDIRVGTGTTGCVKDADGTVITGTCSSDARFKRGITPFPKLLDQLVRLQPVNFFWRKKEFPEKGFGSSQSFGLVAQDVERILPELVTQDEKGFKAVRYHELPLMMLQGLKELKAENDSLRQQNYLLKQRLEAQDARLRRVEKKLHK